MPILACLLYTSDAADRRRRSRHFAGAAAAGHSYSWSARRRRL